MPTDTKNVYHRNFYEILSMDRENDILIVDPFAINMSDIRLAGIKRVLRLRRPFWGTGNLSKFINKISPEDLKKVLKDIEDQENSEGRN